MKRNHRMSATIAAAAAILGACATAPDPAELDRQAQAMMRASFRDQGIAKVERLNQDPAQAACSGPGTPPEALTRQIQEAAMASVRWPADGHYLGDWQQGEKLAQNGRGMTWSDPSADPRSNGAQCYNCHQLDKKEISFGTIGPSLYRYGKNRGVQDPSSEVSAGVVQYTWAKLWNSRAYAACSNMPRFGHAGLLTEQQIRDVMALLLDPKSPVNQ